MCLYKVSSLCSFWKEGEGLRAERLRRSGGNGGEFQKTKVKSFFFSFFFFFYSYCSCVGELMFTDLSEMFGVVCHGESVVFLLLCGVEEEGGGRRGMSEVIAVCMLNSSVDANFSPSYYFNNLHLTTFTWIICLQTRLFREGGSRVISCFRAFIPIT